MHPPWAARAASSADTLAVPRTPASSPPSVGRVQIAAPPPAGSSPPRTPLVAPARIVPPASSLRPPLPLHGKWAIAAGFLLRRNRSIRLLREGFSLRRSHLDDEIYTIKELSEHLRVHRATIYRLLRQGRLPGFRVGSDWRFSRAAIEQWERLQ